MIALASATVTEEARVSPCSVRAFHRSGKLTGLWLEWDASILKPRSKPARGLEIDYALMLNQLKSSLESAPNSFKVPKVKAICILPQVSKREPAIRKMLRASGVLQELSSIELSCIQRQHLPSGFNRFLVPDGYPAVREDPSGTSVYLLPLDEQIAAITHGHISELIRISTGRVTLIG